MATNEPVRVMVVDDQPDVRFLLRVILGEEPDIEVVADAESADAALGAVDAADPHVALVDARMPRMDGFELTPRLLERRPGLRVALLTTIVDDVIRERAQAAGAAACLSKDEFDGLAAVLRELMGEPRP
jgi:DNA-binding NarL/FixJ family response regulator